MKKGYFFILLSTLLFSTMEIGLKSISGDFNPIQLTFGRFFIGSIVLLPFAIKHLKKKDLSITISDLKDFSILGFICVVLGMILYQLAIITTKASVVAVIFSCNSVFVMVLACLILREKIYKHNIASIVLQIIGVLIIINPFNTKLTTSGVLLTLISAASFATYSVLGKRKTSKFGGVTVTCFSFIFGSLELLFITFITKIDSVSAFLNSNSLGVFADIPILSGYSFDNILPVLYVFICATGLGYTFYFKAMEETSATTASLVFFFKPMLSPILALILLKENIPFNMGVGIIFILLGSLCSILPNMKNNHRIAIKHT